jgi:hypothetical protein
LYFHSPTKKSLNDFSSPSDKCNKVLAVVITGKGIRRSVEMPTGAKTIHAEKNTFDFFHTHVKQSLENQHIEITEISKHYLVHLLADFALTQKAFNLKISDGRPLALIYHHAQFETAYNKIKIFKALGDFSLFTTGFFPDSFNQKVIDVDYYIALGRSAYGTLSTIFEKTQKSDFNLLFHELAEKFVELTDILAEISSESFMKCNNGILRLYERWLKTRSRRDEQLLHKKGIIPNHTLTHRTIQ